MKKLTFAIVLMLWSVVSLAESVAPAPRDITIQRTVDRMSLPSGNISIWSRESGGYDTDDPGKWGRNTWVCESDSDPVHGQCRTNPVWFGSGSQSIPILFTEKRSGMRVILNLTGYHEEHFRDTFCSGYPGPYPVWAAAIVGCQGGGMSTPEAVLTVYIPASELRKIPVGGLWQAELHLKLTQWDPKTFLADFRAHLDLNVIDPSHIDIYFPAFGTASPLMELNLQPQGAPDGNAWAHDYSTLDMCLYDGYNVNSTRYDVLIKDEGAAAEGRQNGDFSIYREGGSKGPVRDRIDFHLKMKSPQNGDMIDVNNGEQITWTSFNDDTIRPVRLPSISYPVLCAPTPLVFIVDKFNIRDKNAGHYRGTVTVMFTPTTPTVD